jgi:hypothetical protein
MTISSESLKLIEEQKKTRDQAVLDPNIFIKDFPLDPFTPYLKTNNFIQQGVNRLLGYDSGSLAWIRLKADSDGYLRNRATLLEREAFDVTVFDGESLIAGGVITHDGIDVSGNAYVSCLVSTTQSCTVYLQGSNDNVTFYDLKTDADADVSFACNNEHIWFRVPIYTHYLRVTIQNVNATTGTISLVVMAEV